MEYIKLEEETRKTLKESLSCIFMNVHPDEIPKMDQNKQKINFIFEDTGYIVRIHSSIDLNNQDKIYFKSILEQPDYQEIHQIVVLTLEMNEEEGRIYEAVYKKNGQTTKGEVVDRIFISAHPIQEEIFPIVLEPYPHLLMQDVPQRSFFKSDRFIGISPLKDEIEFQIHNNQIESIPPEDFLKYLQSIFQKDSITKKDLLYAAKDAVCFQKRKDEKFNFILTDM